MIQPLMDTDKTEPIYKAEFQLLVDCAKEVRKGLGHGFHGMPYEKHMEAGRKMKTSEHLCPSEVDCQRLSVNFRGGFQNMNPGGCQ